MATKLKDLTLSELSFVNKAANRHAKIAIFKSAESIGEPITKSEGVFDEPTHGCVDGATEVDMIDATLDALAQQRANEKNITKAAAMVEVLNEPSGSALYTDRCAAMNDPKVVGKRYAAVMKRVPEVRKISTEVAKAERSIEDYAKSIQRPGENEAAAMTRALGQRPDLYRAYLAAQAQAAR